MRLAFDSVTEDKRRGANPLQFTFLQTLCVFSHNQVVNAVLDIAVHESRQIVAENAERLKESEL